MSKARVFGPILKRLAVFGALAASAALAGTPTSLFAPPTELAPLPGHDFSLAFALNEAGQIIGLSAPDAESPDISPVYWERSGAVHRIAAGGQATSINESGKVCGASGGRGFVFDIATQTLVRLGGLNVGNSNARSINDAGDVAGVAGFRVTLDDGSVLVRRRAAFWPHDTVAEGASATQLPTLGGTMSESVVYAMNNLGQITGQSSKDDGKFYPVLWQPGDAGYQLVELPNQVGPSDYGRWINDLGQIAGTTGLLPVVWDLVPTLQITQLRVPAAALGPEGTANGINNRSETVGFIGINGEDPARQPRGVYWRNGAAEPVYLGTLGGDHSFPRGINDHGVIVGDSGRADGSTRGFVIWRD